MKVIEKVVPDTSVIINGIVSRQLAGKKLKIRELLIHQAMIAELEHLANLNREAGWIGLDELKRLRELAKVSKMQIRYEGRRPSASEIKYAHQGEIDALIRSLAFDLGATLITSDKVQAEVAGVMGIKTLYFPREIKAKQFSFLKFFEPDCMSVHLKENELPKAKKGVPGAWRFVEISKTKMKKEALEALSEEVVEASRSRERCFLEIERRGSVIAQLEKFRIVITKSPLSDGWEITIVQPIKDLTLPDYRLSEKLALRIAEKAEGILVAGAPGHGKTTFCEALAKEYAKKGQIVKAIEAPRDMQLPAEITQFSISKATHEEINDILLLTRLDYTIFDEMRNTSDFKLYADLRLAGVGMVGVVHATNPIDAVQRFIGRIELGMIPSIIDTVIFVQNGKIAQVLELRMTIKVPTGMTEADLIRPVIEVRDFESKQLQFEIYTYGEQTVVIPVKPGVKKEGASAIPYRLRETKKFLTFYLSQPVQGASLLIGDQEIAQLSVRKGRIDIRKYSGLGRRVMDALRRRQSIAFA